MKVFGGNGRRQSNSGRAAEVRRTNATGRNNINEANRGNNNSSVSRRREAPEPKKKGRGWLTALLVILVIVGLAFAYWTITTAPPDTLGNLPSDPNATPLLTDTPEREIGRYYTLLVVGIDQLNANTDTIMLVRYDAVEYKANIISIPRDTLVNVSYPVKKINAVYSYAQGKGEDGIQALMDAVEGICGFRPDSYVCINTEVFKTSIDTLGGVFFEVPVDMNYDDYSDQNNDGVTDYVFSIHVQKGYQLLNGENALGVFRFRQNNDGTGYAMGDIERLETQHALIKAVAQQGLQLKNITKLIEIAGIVYNDSETNMTNGNLQWYASEFLKMSMEDINISTMPTTGAWINGLAYVTINKDEWLTIVNGQLNPMKNPMSAEDCSIVCQKNPESDKYAATPGNYFTTDGSEVTMNFYKNY